MAGAFVISLDFELHWGVRDHRPLDAAERQRLLNARLAIPKILRTFGEHQIRATWATVGLLFAASQAEAEEFRPEFVPAYAKAGFDPYSEALGRDEAEDPFHFALSLIREIAQQAGQEIGSHSFSHFYALEEGQRSHHFKADVASAQRIAENAGYRLRSYVFPRNQVRPGYLPILAHAGFHAYRGTEPATTKAAVNFDRQRKPWFRALRLLDAYANVHGMQTVPWPAGGHPLAVDASRYLRPYRPELRAFEKVRLGRIEQAMRSAAIDERIFHLWWHPEDFAFDQERNIEFLQKVLALYEACRREFGMLSMSMADVSEALLKKADHAAMAGVV